MSTPLGRLAVVDVDELERLIEGRVREAVRDEVQAIAAPRFLTVAEVAEMLRVCTKTVHRLVDKEGLPYARKLGREMRFDQEAVVAWMRASPAPKRRGHLERVK